ncbi:MAG: hypothetical protein JWN14_4363 [Chthonomonadales bacterium]|nr:hypothetical protein [Chthonomonadales bacterium]
MSFHHPPPTIPLPLNWQDHIADFVIHIGRSLYRGSISEEERSQVYRSWGAEFEPETGRPQPFQWLDMPCKILYTAAGAQVNFYRDGQLEDNYAVLLRLVSEMLAAGVEIGLQHGRAKYKSKVRSLHNYFGQEGVCINLQDLADQGLLQLVYPSPSMSLRARSDRILARYGLVTLPEPFPSEIILPVESSRPDDLFEAARQGSLNRIRAFLAEGIDVEERNEHSQTALMVAASRNRIEVVRLLLEMGADVNACATSGWTALMSSAMSGNEALLKLLLTKGAFVDACAVTCQTALRVAAIHGHDACVRLLLKEGARLDPVEDPLHYTTLMFACTQCSRETVALLITLGSDVDTTALDHMTPLLCAKAAGRKDLVALLQEYGATA